MVSPHGSFGGWFSSHLLERFNFAPPTESFSGATMLHTALVISAYMSMIFIPCACAQWGDVLTAEWRSMRREFRLDMRRRREGMSETLIRSLREARAAAQIAALAR